MLAKTEFTFGQLYAFSGFILVLYALHSQPIFVFQGASFVWPVCVCVCFFQVPKSFHFLFQMPFGWGSENMVSVHLHKNSLTESDLVFIQDESSVEVMPVSIVVNKTVLLLILYTFEL